MPDNSATTCASLPEDSGELAVVAGASGRTGSLILQELSRRGYRTRALTQNATSQGVLAQVKQDIKNDQEPNLFSVDGVGDAAEYLGQLIRAQQLKHADAVVQAGFSPDATFIIGGQVGERSPKIYMVYPQGNYITTSIQTPFLQVGESKYGKAILDRIIKFETGLDLFRQHNRMRRHGRYRMIRSGQPGVLRAHRGFRGAAAGEHGHLIMPTIA